VDLVIYWKGTDRGFDHSSVAKDVYLSGDQIVQAEETCNEDTPRFLIDFLGSADLLYSASVHYDHVVGDGKSFLLVVRYI